MARITIFGLTGTGTHTIAKGIAEHLQVNYISSGDIFRKKADALGMSLYEFDALASKDPLYDREIDAEISKYAEAETGYVLKSRLGWYLLPSSYKIKIKCDRDVRISRVAIRDDISIEEADNKTKEEEEAGIKRYMDNYGIKHFAPDSSFDLVLDSTHDTLESLIQVILEKFK